VIQAEHSSVHTTSLIAKFVTFHLNAAASVCWCGVQLVVRAAAEGPATLHYVSACTISVVSDIVLVWGVLGSSQLYRKIISISCHTRCVVIYRIGSTSRDYFILVSCVGLDMEKMRHDF